MNLTSNFQVKGQSWAGIGWRPYNLDPSCRAFPLIEGPEGTKEGKSVKLRQFHSENTAKGVIPHPRTWPLSVLFTFNQSID